MLCPKANQGIQTGKNPASPSTGSKKTSPHQCPEPHWGLATEHTWVLCMPRDDAALHQPAAALCFQTFFILLKNKDQETAVGLCSHPNCPQLKGSAEDSAHGQLQGVLRQSSCRDDVLELPIACRDPLPKTLLAPKSRICSHLS